MGGLGGGGGSGSEPGCSKWWSRGFGHHSRSKASASSPWWAAFATENDALPQERRGASNGQGFVWSLNANPTQCWQLLRAQTINCRRSDLWVREKAPPSAVNSVAAIPSVALPVRTPQYTAVVLLSGASCGYVSCAVNVRSTSCVSAGGTRCGLPPVPTSENSPSVTRGVPFHSVHRNPRHQNTGLKHMSTCPRAVGFLTSPVHCQKLVHQF